MEAEAARGMRRDIAPPQGHTFTANREQYRQNHMRVGPELPAYNDLTGRDRVQWNIITDDQARLARELFEDIARDLTLPHCRLFIEWLTNDQAGFARVVARCRDYLPEVFNEYQAYIGLPNLNNQVQHFLSLIYARLNEAGARNVLQNFVAVLREANMNEMFVMIYDMLILCGAREAFSAYWANRE